MCAPTLKDITRAHSIMNHFRNDWLETVWLGCSIERYLEIKSWDDMLAWVEENESQRNSDLGLFIRASLEFGLDKFATTKISSSGLLFSIIKSEPSGMEIVTFNTSLGSMLNKSLRTQ